MPIDAATGMSKEGIAGLHKASVIEMPFESKSLIEFSIVMCITFGRSL